ncbi:MAG TPA: ATP-binding protein [Armatimonadota bacterium]|nr:ATP-binding protein [Armatimonadota bacterium]
MARTSGEPRAGETPEVGVVLVDSDTRELRVSSEFRHGHRVRAFVREAVEECGFDKQAVADLMLAVTEIFNNAVEHAHHFEAHREVVIRVHRHQGAIQVDITDQGPGFVPREAATPPASFLPTQRGLGLFLARNLMDEIHFSHGAGTTVHLVKHTPR